MIDENGVQGEGTEEVPEQAVVQAEVQTEAPAEQPEPADPTLSDNLLSRFEDDLAQKGLDAYARWGFALFHSQGDEQSAKARAQLGMKPIDAVDHYNEGCVQAQSGDFAAAAASFKTALEMDSNFGEARFNLGVALDKSGDAAGAREHIKQYLDTLEEPEEADQVRQYLGELAGR